MSNPSVYPKTWFSGGKNVLKDKWRIQYYFYDETNKRKLVIVKGMNSYKELAERRHVHFFVCNHIFLL